MICNKVLRKLKRFRNRVLRAFKKLYSFIFSLIEKKQASINLTLDEYKVLIVLFKKGEMSFYSLSIHLNFKIYNLKSTLKNLKEKQYIDVYSSSSSKERKLYSLTPQTRLSLNKAKVKMKERED